MSAPKCRICKFDPPFDASGSELSSALRINAVRHAVRRLFGNSWQKRPFGAYLVSFERSCHKIKNWLTKISLGNSELFADLKTSSGDISPLFKFGPDYRGTYKNNQKELENSIELIREDFFWTFREKKIFWKNGNFWWFLTIIIDS